jgi:hypothetical protein
MANDQERSQQPQQESGSADSQSSNQQEQFNELSELSLEERMNAADQMGVPMNTKDAVATGAMRGHGIEEDANDGIEIRSSEEENDR